MLLRIQVFLNWVWFFWLWESDFSGGVKSGLGLFASREPVLDLWGDIWEPSYWCYNLLPDDSKDEVVSDFRGQYYLADEYIAHGDDSLFRSFVN